VGFAIGILFVEVIFANNQSWPDVVPFCWPSLAGLPEAKLFAGFAADLETRLEVTSRR
jgi:hypothetical protein